MILSPERRKAFQTRVLSYYSANKRSMPWRENLDPYYIFVSEIMLQQTQVDRVIPKFIHFIQLFPTFEALASASRISVLKMWSGLGYNRRAVWLHENAQLIVRSHSGRMPERPEDLVSLRGIGHNTAAAICTYAYNQPHVFIETNIRAVYIDEFFPNHEKVADKELYPLVEQTLCMSSPREWYWALMDYGSHIKTVRKNPSVRSAHHKKQSRFQGSMRQVRGQVLRMLLDGPQNISKLSTVGTSIDLVLSGMEKDGLLVRDGDMFSIREVDSS